MSRILTWQNVAAPDLRGTTDGIRAASEMLERATKHGVGAVDTARSMKQRQMQDLQDQATRQWVEQMLSAQTPEQYKDMQAQGFQNRPDGSQIDTSLISPEWLMEMDARRDVLDARHRDSHAFEARKEAWTHAEWERQQDKKVDRLSRIAAPVFAKHADTARTNPTAAIRNVMSELQQDGHDVDLPTVERMYGQYLKAYGANEQARTRRQANSREEQSAKVAELIERIRRLGMGPEAGRQAQQIAEEYPPEVRTQAFRDSLLRGFYDTHLAPGATGGVEPSTSPSLPDGRNIEQILLDTSSTIKSKEESLEPIHQSIRRTRELRGQGLNHTDIATEYEHRLKAKLNDNDLKFNRPEFLRIARKEAERSGVPVEFVMDSMYELAEPTGIPGLQRFNNFVLGGFRVNAGDLRKRLNRYKTESDFVDKHERDIQSQEYIQHLGVKAIELQEKYRSAVEMAARYPNETARQDEARRLHNEVTSIERQLTQLIGAGNMEDDSTDQSQRASEMLSEGAGIRSETLTISADGKTKKAKESLPLPAPGELPQPETIVEARPGAIPEGQGQMVTVTYVVDGDTFQYRPKGSGKNAPVATCRLDAVDAPEIGHRGEPDQPFGREAKRTLQSMVESGDVTIRVTGTDKNGRDLCQVEVEGRDVGVDLVKAGLAWLIEDTYLFSHDIARRNQLIAAQSEAIHSRAGLFGNTSSLRPDVFRAVNR